MRAGGGEMLGGGGRGGDRWKHELGPSLPPPAPGAVSMSVTAAASMSVKRLTTSHKRQDGFKPLTAFRSVKTASSVSERLRASSISQCSSFSRRVQASHRSSISECSSVSQRVEASQSISRQRRTGAASHSVKAACRNLNALCLGGAGRRGLEWFCSERR